ncbi:hypothetical protein DFS33DRAFT_1270640 [Desarmillaria ectypa]|nr:hypothetical protein DFS33DRAFT_1270640 [Desarmillaria ectypa]
MLASIMLFVSLSGFVPSPSGLPLCAHYQVSFLFRLTSQATDLYGIADANGSATFGVWGYCHLNVEQYADLTNKGSAADLVLHSIARGLAFLTFLSSLFIIYRGTGRLPSLCILGIGLVATILTTIAFLIDVIVVAIIRHRVNDKTDGQLQLTWGNAVWMVLGATVALWCWFMLWHMCLRKTPS